MEFSAANLLKSCGAWHVAQRISPGRNFSAAPHLSRCQQPEVSIMDGIIYLIGLIVIVMAILSFFGLR
jgi:hypothetical protein